MLEVLDGGGSTGQRGGRNKNGNPRIVVLQALNQFHRRQHLAYRDSMKPYTPGTRRFISGRQQSETLWKMGEVGAVADSPVE